MQLVVGNSYAKILQASTQEESFLREYLTFHSSNPQGKDTSHCLLSAARMFPAGLAARVVASARERGMEVAVAPRKPTVAPLAVPRDGLWPHQVRALDAIWERRRGIIQHATGTGKATTIAALVAEINAPVLVLVTSIKLMHEMYDRIKKVAEITPGRFGDSYKELKRPVIVATVNSAVKLPKQKIDSFVAVLGDEVHGSGGNTYLSVVLSCVNAEIRIGFSGTPLHRSDKKSIYTIGAFGDVIDKYMPAQAASDGITAKANLTMVPMHHAPVSAVGGYVAWEKQAIAKNNARNTLILRLIATTPAPRIVFVRTHEHQAILMKQLGNTAVHVNDKVSMNDANRAVRQLVNGTVGTLISTSLPPEEPVLVRSGDNIRLVGIGTFVDKMFEQGQDWRVWSRLHNGEDGWAEVTGVVSHPRNGVPVVESYLRGGASVRTTANHALIAADGSSQLPEVGASICRALHAPLDSAVEFIDVPRRLRETSADLHHIEVELLGMNQVNSRTFKSELHFLLGGEFSDTKTLERVKGRVDSRSAAREEQKHAITELFKTFAYYKGKWRGPVPNSAEDYDYLHVLGLTARIVGSHTTSPVTLPLRLPVTEELAHLSGIFVAEGCTTAHQQVDSVLYSCAMAALQRVPDDAREGFRDKIKIRAVYSDSCHAVLGIRPRETAKLMILGGKLAYLFFRHVLCVGGLAPTKSVPDFVWAARPSVREAFLWGYFLGDGHRDLRRANCVTYTTVSRELAIGTYTLLLSLGKSASVYSSSPGGKRLRRYNVYCRSPIFGFDMENRRTPPVREPHATISSVRVSDAQPETVYDLSVAGVERFYAGFGVLAHNTIFRQGVDIPEIATVIQASGGKAVVDIIQKVGRGSRRHMKDGTTKDNFYVFDILDRGCGCRGSQQHKGCQWLEKHSQERKNAYERFGYVVRTER